MDNQCEAAEYRFISEQIREWEEIYARDEHHRERDIRDDLLTLYRRGVEIQLTTIFELRRNTPRPAAPATPLDRGDQIPPNPLFQRGGSGEAGLAPTKNGDFSLAAHPAQVTMVEVFQRAEVVANRVLAKIDRIEKQVIRLEERLFGWIDRLIDKLDELVGILIGRGRNERN